MDISYNIFSVEIPTKCNIWLDDHVTLGIRYAPPPHPTPPPNFFFTFLQVSQNMVDMTIGDNLEAFEQCPILGVGIQQQGVLRRGIHLCSNAGRPSALVLLYIMINNKQNPRLHIFQIKNYCIGIVLLWPNIMTILSKSFVL